MDTGCSRSLWANILPFCPQKGTQWCAWGEFWGGNVCKEVTWQFSSSNLLVTKRGTSWPAWSIWIFTKLWPEALGDLTVVFKTFYSGHDDGKEMAEQSLVIPFPIKTSWVQRERTLTLVVLILLPVAHIHPELSGNVLHSSPSRQGSISHHHFPITIEAKREKTMFTTMLQWPNLIK